LARIERLKDKMSDLELRNVAISKSNDEAKPVALDAIEKARQLETIQMDLKSLIMEDKSKNYYIRKLAED
jgi:hypothetical protein